MNIRCISLISVLFLVLCSRTGAQTVTFNSSGNSSIIVNGHDPVLTVNAPGDGVLDTLDSNCVGGTCTYTVTFSADVDSFELNAATTGEWPCASSSESMMFLSAYDTSIWKGGGQYIIVIVDNGPARAVKYANMPVQIPVPSATPGPHTLRAFMCRSWDESIKDVNSISPTRRTRLYSVHTFYVDTNTGAHAIDTTVPLLTPSAPLDTSTWVYHPDSVLLDFYLMFRELSDDYVVEATIYDSTMNALESDTLSTWGPYCISGLQEPPEGRLRRYYIRARLLDSGFNPVTNGPGNFNDRTWAFHVRRR